LQTGGGLAVCGRTREVAMIVKNILLGKSGNVVRIEPNADLADSSTAAGRATHRCGCHPRCRSPHCRHPVVARYCARARRAWADSAARTGRSGHDARRQDLLGRRHHRGLDGSNDNGKIPPYAGGAAGKAHRYRVDWRCGQEPRRGDRTRNRSATRLHPSVIRSMAHRTATFTATDWYQHASVLK
jgi:hypothetical protein